MLKDDSININQQNLKVLAVEMYKTFYKLSPEFMWDLVEEINIKYQIRSSYDIGIDENKGPAIFNVGRRGGAYCVGVQKIFRSFRRGTKNFQNIL